MELLDCVRSSVVQIAKNADKYIFCYQGWNFLEVSLLDDVPFLVQPASENRTKGTMYVYSILYDYIRMRRKHSWTLSRVFGPSSIKPEH
jgi:hypothetical protein